MSTDAEIKFALEFLEQTRLFEVLGDEHKRNAAFERDIIGKYRLLLQNLEKVRDALERLSVDAYDWHENPSVRNKIKQLAEAEYNAGGSDKALKIIDEMPENELKQYLKRLVRESITVGIEIIANGGDYVDAD